MEFDYAVMYRVIEDNDPDAAVDLIIAYIDNRAEEGDFTAIDDLLSEVDFTRLDTYSVWCLCSSCFCCKEHLPFYDLFLDLALLFFILRDRQDLASSLDRFRE